MPLGWITLSFIAFIFIKNRKWKKRLGVVCIVLTIFFTNPFLASEVMRAWEFEPIPFSEITNSFDLAIVLTGVSDNSKQPNDRVYFNKGADRVTHAVQLYKLGKVKNILIAGGSGSFQKVPISEAENLKKAFLMMGVPDSVIFVETKSKNTHQSAVNSAEILKGKSFDSIMLITSSFHLKRAQACFLNEGITTFPFPADYYSSPRTITPDAWIPHPKAMMKWTVVFHEMLGIASYWMMGYI